MKINKYVVLMISATLITACAEELVEQSINVKSKSIITANLDDSQTKASVTSRGEFFWNSGDKIDVYTDSERFLEFSIESGVGTKSAKFSGDLAETEGVSTIAVYPIGLSPVMTDDGVSITLPSEYDLEDDNLVCKTPMVAEIDGNGKAVFKHLAGLMRFSFRGIPEEAIKLYISADTKISGEFVVSNGVISTQSSDTAAGVVVNLGKFYNTRDLVVNLPIPTGHYTEINISFLDEAGNIVYEKESTKARTVSAGDMYAFTPIVINHSFVDLGLPSGTLWAEYNVGAFSPEEYGDYFSYGEIAPKEWYSKDTYSFDKSLEKGENLELEDDAAYVIWGEKWRMPTKEEWQELFDNCTSTETSYNGVKGWMFTGPNGQTLFFPNAGMYYSDNDKWLIGSAGRYLSSTSVSWGCYVGEMLDDAIVKESNLFYGQSLRAVANIVADMYLVPAITLEVGNQKILNVNTTETVVWTSSDESIATVTSSGEVTGISEGKVEIRATVGSVTRSCEVSVVQRPNMNVRVIAKSCTIINGTIMRGSSVTWMLQNLSDSVVDLKTAQIVDHGSSLYGNRMDLNETVFANGSTAYTITFNNSIPTTAVIIYTVEYKGLLFEYVAGIE